MSAYEEVAFQGWQHPVTRQLQPGATAKPRFGHEFLHLGLHHPFLLSAYPGDGAWLHQNMDMNFFVLLRNLLFCFFFLLWVCV